MLSSLVSEWTFDELMPDGKTKDTWGSNHGTVYEAEWVDDCVFGKCYKFNGNYNNRIQLDESPDFIQLNDAHSFTMSVWVNPNSYPASSHYAAIFGKRFKNAISMGSNGHIRTGLREASFDGYQSNSKVNIGDWAFITTTYNSNTKLHEVYINGKFDNSKTLTETGVNTSGYWFIGGDAILGGTTGYFFGLIDDVRIYNSALSSAQIKQNYIAGLDSMLRKGTLSKDEYNERLEALATNQI